jgi:hypothetical protein
MTQEYTIILFSLQLIIIVLCIWGIIREKKDIKQLKAEVSRLDAEMDIVSERLEGKAEEFPLGV